MHGLYLSGAYPIPSKPFHGVFFRNLIEQLSNQWRDDATVIRPFTLTELRHSMTPPKANVLKVDSGNSVQQYYPAYLSISNRLLPRTLAAELTVRLFVGASERLARSKKLKPDFTYGHFLTPGGVAAAYLGRKFNIPSFIALGESSFDSLNKAFTSDKLRSMTSGVSGVVAVSSHNAEFAARSLRIPEENIIVLPNSADTTLFQPMDKQAVRDQLSLPREKVLIAFVGAFIERKGPNRLLKAIEGIPDVAVMLMGDGPLELSGPSVCFRGRVEHELLPKYLGAADLFVLPTQAEGSSNAVAEALTAGLPVITSDRSFSKDLVDQSRGILVDPDDVDAIRNAILTLVNQDDLRERMGRNARKWAEENSLINRVTRIRSFIENRTEQYHRIRVNR